MAPTVRTVEELSFRAWPALEQQVYDDWLLRFANGYSKRGNSVNPLGPGTLDVQTKIDTCCRIYRTRGLKPVFRLTPLAGPANLDRFLAERGFRQKDTTCVQLLELAGRFQATEAFQQWPILSAAWWTAYHGLSGFPAHQTHWDILNRISSARCFALLIKEGRPVAAGLGVLEDNCAGLFNLVTAPAERRKGYGRELVANILAWAAARGGRWAYLQVLAGNEPALALYRGLGFQELYRYWYRLEE